MYSKTANNSSVCFYSGCFLRSIRCLWELAHFSKGSILLIMANSPLGNCHITGWCYCHWFDYILWCVELKMASVHNIWVYFSLTLALSCHFVVLHHPSLSTPIWVLVVYSKMAGKLASYVQDSKPTKILKIIENCR